MLTYVAIGLIAIAVLGILALLIYYRVKQKRYMQNAALFNKDKLLVKERTNYKELFDKIYQSVYLTFVKMPIIKNIWKMVLYSIKTNY